MRVITITLAPEDEDLMDMRIVAEPPIPPYAQGSDFDRACLGVVKAIYDLSTPSAERVTLNGEEVSRA